ncbi:MAG TPA: OsmC family protein [Spirochaetota bacterium]|nr:OsmC family protein [Spirochaetota bacterium]
MDMQITLPGGKRVDAQYKGFDIKTDQPAAAGGEGSAPSPFDLFLASLGTCAGFYVLSFCQERNIPTDDIHLVMRTERDPQKKMIGRVTIDIILPEEFPEKYLSAVRQSAGLCTVKRNIQNPPEFDIRTIHPSGGTGE